MAISDWLVIFAGAGAIAWINWYFFISKPSSAVAHASGARQEARITVRGGYDPSVVRVKAGTPVRLLFDRQETSGCSEEIVFPDFGIKRYLPANETTAIEITPSKPGNYEFTCGMSMLRGRLVAE